MRPAEELVKEVYTKLRALAGSYFRGQPGAHTLQPTALVHEAFLKLAAVDPASWNDRSHFLAVAATAMRQILTDHARRRKAEKRGGQRERVTLSGIAATQSSDVDLIALDEIMGKLAAIDERGARLVELRFFAGMTEDEAAAALSVSTRTVQKDWRRVKAWLAVELDRAPPEA
jgi:RNA polymerase sigma-70 factor, ECF subfamily